MTRTLLTAVAFDAGTQIRAAIDPQVVTDYAEAMTAGATFPPIVLFHDGNQHYLADGFHRFMAAQRLAFKDIDADVRPGTKDDALWFALGANRTNGKRLSEADKTHAIELARLAWPEKMQREIAEQVGCHQSLVSRIYGKYTMATSHEPVLTGRARRTRESRESIAALLKEGRSSDYISKQIGVSGSTIHDVRVEIGMARGVEKSRSAVVKRREQMREMAEAGHSSTQIAAAVGVDERTCRQTLRESQIDVPADKALAKSRRHDSTRIVEHIVMDAENLTADVNLIDFASLERDQLGAWADSLIASKKALDTFIKRLIKEHQKHGEAA